MDLRKYLKSEVAWKMVNDDITHFRELKGGMSSNKCFHMQTTEDEYTMIVFREDKRTDEEILAWHEVTNNLKDFLPSVRHPVSKDFERFKYKGRYMKTFLYNYIEGKTIQWSAYNSNEVVQLASVMRRLHDKLQTEDYKLPDWDNLIIKELESFLNYINHVRPYIAEKLAFEIDYKKLNRNIARIIDFVMAEKEKTVLHYDLQRANLIFKNNSLNGIIDFEKACYGPRIADIAMSCSYLMLDKRWHSNKYLKYYFLKGYGMDTDMKMFHALVIHHFLMEMKMWMVNTPFESLGKNKVFKKIIHFLEKNKYVRPLQTLKK